MSGTTTGGQKTAVTNKKLHGKDYYVRIGATGGSKSRTGGFFANRELASVAGKIGGHMGRKGRKGAEVTEINTKEIYRAYKHLQKIQETAERKRQLML